MQSVLHVGCGGDLLPSWLADSQETRLDIDARHNPDIVANMADLGEIGHYDVVLCQHALEHVYPDDVPRVLAEFFRVLNPQGRAVIVVPDLEGVLPTDEVLYLSPAGPITGLDMIFGLRKAVKETPAMQHHTGFVQWTLERALLNAGFKPVVRRVPDYNLLAIAVKP